MISMIINVKFDLINFLLDNFEILQKIWRVTLSPVNIWCLFLKWIEPLVLGVILFLQMLNVWLDSSHILNLFEIVIFNGSALIPETVEFLEYGRKLLSVLVEKLLLPLTNSIIELLKFLIHFEWLIFLIFQCSIQIRRLEQTIVNIISKHDDFIPNFLLLNKPQFFIFSDFLINWIKQPKPFLLTFFK